MFLIGRIEKLKVSKNNATRRLAHVAEGLARELASRIDKGLLEICHDESVREELKRLAPDLADRVDEVVREDLAVAPSLGLTAQDTLVINLETAAQTFILARQLVEQCRSCCTRAEALCQPR